MKKHTTIALLAIAALAASAFGEALDTSPFACRVPISVSGYTGETTLTNFPVLVTLEEDAPVGFHYVSCAGDGSDIRFADAEGNLIPHEMDTWDPNGTSLVWVGIPVLTNRTAFTMYYGASDPGAASASNVWSRYAVVIHGGASLTNAVGNGLAVTAGSTSVAANAAAGRIGGGIRKETNKSIGVNVVNPSPMLSGNGKFSVSAWFKRNGNGGKNNGTHILAGSQTAWGTTGFLWLQEQGKYISVAAPGSHQWSSGSCKLADGVWAHAAFAYESGVSLVGYFNGASYQTNSSPGNLVSTSGPWTFGSYANTVSDDSFKGDMDELRVFDGVASGDWIKAEHDTADDPASFAEPGAVVPATAGKPQFGSAFVSDENGTATFSVALAVPGYGGEVQTDVSVFYGTNGVDWAEVPLGATNEAATLTGSVSGLTGNVRILWFARATATRNGADKTVETGLQEFITKIVEPAGNYKYFTATVDWDGAPAENIPVLLRLSEAAVSGFSYRDVADSGLEIFDGNGRLLPFDKDIWNTNGVSYLWVLLPDYRNGATFTVRYSAPLRNAYPSSDTWDDYLGVWHMNSVSPADSSPNGFDGTNKTANLTVVDGAIGAAVNIPRAIRTSIGYQDGITCGNVLPNSELVDGYTIEGWCRPEQYGEMGEGTAMFGKYNFVSLRILSDTRITLTTPGKKDHFIDLGSGVMPAANTWWHFAATFKMNTSNNGLNFYINGQLVKSITAEDINDKTNATEMFLGNNQWDQAFRGGLDEMRLSANLRSAEWIAADYHAMADASGLVCGAVSSSDTAVPVLGTPSVASNGDGSFTVSVVVSNNVPATGTVKCAVGGTDFPMATADTELPQTYSATVSGLAPGTHAVTVRASSTGGTTVYASSALHAGVLAVDVVSNADEGSLEPGVFRVSRTGADPSVLPELAFDVAFSGDGLAAIESPLTTTFTIPADAAFVDITVTPIHVPAINADTYLTLAVSGACVGTPSSSTMTIVNADYDIAVRYVATDGDDANHGGTPELPKATIRAAIDSLANVALARTCTVQVAAGRYPVSRQLELYKPIRLLGYDADPSRVVVSNTLEVNSDDRYHRCAVLDHCAAMVSGMTFENGRDYDDGGNVLVGSQGGMVTNCVLLGGYSRDKKGGANVAIKGPGLVTHCRILGGFVVNGGGSDRVSSVFLSHADARIENCLVDGFLGATDSTTSAVGCGGIVVDRGKAVNCTVVNCTSPYSAASDFAGIRLWTNGSAKNCVSAGNVDKNGTVRAFAKTEVSRASHCAFDEIAGETGIPEGMLDAVTGTTASFFKNFAAGDYRPKSNGPLVDNGENYAGMAALDLSGSHKRLVGRKIDIGAYEGFPARTMLIIR